MLLEQEYCFVSEQEALSGLQQYISNVAQTDENERLFSLFLSTIFSIRSTLLTRFAHSENRIKGLESQMGYLTDICIIAVEDYVLPSLASLGIDCLMEVRQYDTRDLTGRVPPIHAYVLVKLGKYQFIVDVNADPFYRRNIGVIISPARTFLYRSGHVVHRRRLTTPSVIDRFEFYTKDAELYFCGENIPNLTMRYYFLDSDSNACPVKLSPFTTAYFSYARTWIDMSPHDFIKLVLVSNKKDSDVLLWNLSFNQLAYVELLFHDKRSLRLNFKDGSQALFILDEDGYFLGQSLIKYEKKGPSSQRDLVKRSFSSSPSSTIVLPDPA